MTRSLSVFGSPTKKPSDKPDQNWSSGIIFSLLSLYGPVLDAFLDLIRHTRFDYARGTARIGLSDPSATGVLYGLCWSIRPLLPVNRISLTIVPEFSQEIYEIDLSTRFHIMYPIRIIVNAVKIMKNPAVRKVMKTLRKNLGKVTA